MKREVKEVKDDIKQQLIELSEPDYQKFSSRLIPVVDNVLGVRLPLLRKLAREIVTSDWRSYLVESDETYFEEVMLKGMVIGYLKNQSIEERLNQIQFFISKINNWSVCDSFCSGLKFTKQHREEIWRFIQPYFHSTQEYEVRFAVVMALNYYLDEAYIDTVLEKIDQVKHQGYYVQMAVAWAISICFIKQEEKTLAYLEKHSLDDFTYQKALQKIIESNQVNIKTKERIKKMKNNFK